MFPQINTIIEPIPIEFPIKLETLENLAKIKKEEKIDVDIEKVKSGRSSKNNKNYSLKELKNIAKYYNIDNYVFKKKEQLVEEIREIYFQKQKLKI